MLRRWIVAFLICITTWGYAQTVIVPNPSFESGMERPDSWTPSDRLGVWEKEGHTGSRCISVTGTGQTTSYWSTSDINLKPGKTYRVSFWMKGVGATGGCVISGPSFCNRDFIPGDTWRRYSYVFIVPKETRGWYLRFGQWMVKGKVFLDDIAISEVAPVHYVEGSLQLGDGERIEETRYFAQPALGSEGANYSRILSDFHCGFNSNRWCFGRDSYVVYRHEVGDFTQRSAKVTVNVGYYEDGKCVIEASVNGKDYVPIGEIGKQASETFSLPMTLFPARCIYVRMRGAQASAREGDSAPGSFQIHTYSYEAELDHKVKSVQGNTGYLEVLKTSPDLQVTVHSLGAMRPTPDTCARLEILNRSETPKVARIELSMGKFTRAINTNLAGNERKTVEIPYELTDAGEIPLTLAVLCTGQMLYKAATTFTVPQLYASNYGYRIANTSTALGLWWCEATYKVSRERPSPQLMRDAITLSAAKNEFEPFQLVLRPSMRLQDVTLEVSDLLGPKGHRISKDNVQIDLVDYVRVTHPTDGEGCVGWWPDPLPHYRGAFSVEANRNQPVWLTIYVPANSVAGDYTGTIIVRGSGLAARTPVRLHVFNFTLPRETHIRSGFGVSRWAIQRYHNLTSPSQVNEVMEKYHRAFASHRICPYNPMRPIKVKFSGRNWVGGEIVTDESHSGTQSLKITDASDKSVIAASYATQIPVQAEATYRWSWWCKAPKGQHYMVTLGQHDASGAWRSGHNRDFVHEGNDDWKREEVEVRFDKGTTSVSMTLRPAVWTEDGRFIGTAWFDDVTFHRTGDSANLITDCGFEATVHDIKVEHDFSEFDEDASHFLDEMGYNSFMLPVMGLGGGTFYERHAGELAGFKAGTPEYDTLFARYLKPIEDHLREKGWLKKAYVYWFDEPSEQDYDFVREGMQTLARSAPGICKFLTEKPVKELFGWVDLWCIPVGEFEPEVAAARQTAGEEIWWYLCCGPRSPYIGLFIDHPAIDFRMWLWMSWKWNVQGILIWETTYWTSNAAYPDKLQNPWEDPMSYVSGYGAPPGTKAFWGNGDGRLFYPPNRAVEEDKTSYVEGPVSSIRLELMREGIEDFEYLYLLKSKLASSRSKLSPQHESLLNIPKSIITDLTHFTKDPQLLYAHREKVARAIEQVTAR